MSEVGQILRALVVPPLALFALAAIGALLLRRRRRLGWTIVAVASGLLVLLCLPIVSAALLRSLQPRFVGSRDGAQAIVVLGADDAPLAPEYGGVSVGPLTLERLRYAARLHRESSLPVLVSGGTMRKGDPSLAKLMRDVLESDFAVPVRWMEERSGDTRANARRSSEILVRENVRTVLLVTHAWHMPRARGAFERAGLEVVAAPTGFRAWPDLGVAVVLPSARALRESSWAIHEWIGRLRYALSD